LVTIDCLLSTIEPSFNLLQAIRDARRRIVAARLSPDHWAPVLQAVAWELTKLGDDAPRLLRAALRNLEAGPVVPAAPVKLFKAARWIAAALVIGGVMIDGAIVIG
jgi:ubiquinone biosynthesis protein